MSSSQEVLGILVKLEGKTAFIAAAREEQDAIKGYAAATREAAASSDELAAADAKRAASVTLVNRAVGGLGLMLVATAAESVKMSLNFNRQLEMIHTQAGASQAEVNSFRTSILNLKGVVQSPLELADGLYHLSSVGLRGAMAFKALETAAHGAAIGNANLEDVTTALGAAWTANIKGGGDFNHVMGVVNATVGAGNMRMEQLVQALGTGILPAAKLAGLSIQQVGAALAILSDQGYAPSSAAAQLATSLHFLYDPSTKAKEALESLGLSQEMLVNKLSGPNGAIEALKLLHDRIAAVGGRPQQLETLGNILPGGRGRVLLTLLDEIPRLEMKQKQIESTSGSFGQALRRTMEEPLMKAKEAVSNLEKEMVKFGQTMEGPASSAIRFFAGAAGFALSAILALTDHGKLLIPMIALLTGAWLAYKAAVLASAFASTAFAVVQGGVMLAAIAAETIGIGALSDAFLGLAIAMDANPVGLILLAVAALVIGVVELIQHFNAVKNWVLSNWKVIAAVLLTMLGPIGQLALGIYMLITHWKAVKDFVVSTVGAIGHALASPFDFLWAKAKWVFDHIRDEAKHLPSALLQGTVGKIPLIGGPLAHGIEDAFKGMPHFALGGIMPYSGFAQINENGPGETVWLPGGSRVESGSASSMGAVRAHTPNPTNRAEQVLPGLEAVLVLPNGDVLADLVVKSLTIKKGRQ